MSETEVDSRKMKGLIIASLAVFMALFFNIFIDYVKSVEKNLYVEWDVKTITAGDYSVEVDIPAAMFNHFVNEKFDSTDDRSKATQFRDWFKKELEERLVHLPNLGYEDEGAPMTISQICLAFDNAQAINLLRQRGLAIKTQKFDKMRAVETKIE